MKDKSFLSNLTEKQREQAIDKIIAYFLDERDEEIGIIAATEILEFFETQIAPHIYKRAIEDSKKLVEEQYQQLLFKLIEKTLD